MAKNEQKVMGLTVLNMAAVSERLVNSIRAVFKPTRRVHHKKHKSGEDDQSSTGNQISCLGLSFDKGSHPSPK